MGLTVRELTEITGLRTRFIAGRSGGDRTVLWAHSTEQSDPWNWLGSGDLLLTNGLSVPAEPEAQVRYLRELDRANLAGIVLDEGPYAPEISREALQAADTMGFPFLATEHSMPWTLLVRMVADSNAQKGQALVTKVLRVYDVMRSSYRSQTLSDGLLTKLGAECECVFHAIDGLTGRPLLPTAEPLSERLRDLVLERVRSAQTVLPAFSRLASAEEPTFVLPVAESSGAVLVATPLSRHTDVDLMLLQHVSMIVGLEIERRTAEMLRNRANGSRLLHQLLAGTGDPEAATAQLEAFHLQSPPWRVLAWPDGPELTIDDAQTMLARAEIPALLAYGGSEYLALVPAAVVDDLRAELETRPQARVGASLPVRKLSRLGDAVREARWAQEAARSSDASVSVYGDDASPFLPRSITEGEAVVDQVLGPVLEYDAANDAQLLRSLIAYFDANRSWQEAADALGIHRQTLIYRVSRIEKLTGRRVQNLEDQTELYLAVQTWRMLRARTDGAA